MDSISDLWPLFGLRIETPRLRLQLPPEADLIALAHAGRSIGEPGERQFQLPWMYEPSPAMERELVQRHWRALGQWKPENWHLPLAVYLGQLPIGVQSIWAIDFPRLRSVGTGSWVTRAQQGRGYGTEARTAVLELAFSYLGALEARTEFLKGNRASERIARKLGYTDNGQRPVYRDDAKRTTEYCLNLDLDTWLASGRNAHPVVTGIAPCLSMFGVQT